jgi:hypothetical protein
MTGNIEVGVAGGIDHVKSRCDLFFARTGTVVERHLRACIKPPRRSACVAALQDPGGPTSYVAWFRSRVAKQHPQCGMFARGRATRTENS